MFLDLFLILYRNIAAVVCTSMLSLGIYGSTTSTAQHSEITPAPSSKPSTCGSDYISKESCTYMHAAPGLFFWGIELLAFASHLFASKMLHHLLHSHSVPFFFEASVAGGTAGYAKRLTYIPGCTYVPARTALLLLCHYIFVV